MMVVTIQKSRQEPLPKISWALLRRVILDSGQPCGTTADEILEYFLYLL